MIDVVLALDNDETLLPGNVVDPILDAAGLNRDEYWAGLDRRAKEGVDPGEIYLPELVNNIKSRAPDFGLREMREVASAIPHYRGSDSLIPRLREAAAGCGINLNVGVLTAGLRLMVTAGPIAKHLDWVIGSTVRTNASGKLISAGRIITAEAKGRFLQQIPAGAVSDDLPVTPMHRVIYVGDGFSDLPAFDVVNAGGGQTLVVFKPGAAQAFEIALGLAGRASFMAPADYLEGSMADLWLHHALGMVATM